MSLGRADRQAALADDVDRFCEEALGRDSIYVLLHGERERLFPDEFFADLFAKRGRRSVPPSVVATVMVLQRLEGCSDREAVERYSFDARWRYATGVGGYGRASWGRFAHTVLVDMRERLRRSERPDRVFEVTLEAASSAGLVGRRRVLDSTPLYDAVTTMDTITLIRAALRGLLQAAEGELESALRAQLGSGDDYASAAKPQIDWDDAAARAELIESRARDAEACLALLTERELPPEVAEALALLAAVTGQDLEEVEGHLRIARRVAPDRIISTVDPDARHGHKTAARGFDGYKGHIAIDPDSEIITAAVVTPGNAGDASVAAELIGDLLAARAAATASRDETEPPRGGAADADSDRATGVVVYGDQAYGSGAFQELLTDAGIESRCKTQRPTAAHGMFSKDRFLIDLAAGCVTCPAAVTVTLQRQRAGGAQARFGHACNSCALRADCTTARGGRTVVIGPHEAALAHARLDQRDPTWRDDYRSTRPIVERKHAHLVRDQHGGRRARVRGIIKVGYDFRWRVAAVNLFRLAVLGLRWLPTAGWAVA